MAATTPEPLHGPGTELARATGKSLTEGKQLPGELGRIIDFEGWAQSLIFGVKYKEPDPDYISRILVYNIVMAETIEDVFRQTGVKGVQELVPDSPSAEYGPFELTDLYVASSDFETGNNSFVLLTLLMLESGQVVKCSTGATNIQGELIALLKLGNWDRRAKFKRGVSKDKGGRYLLFLMPPG